MLPFRLLALLQQPVPAPDSGRTPAGRLPDCEGGNPARRSRGARGGLAHAEGAAYD